MSDALLSHPGVPLWRRLAAMIYDSLVLLCVIFVAWVPVPLLPDHLWPIWIDRSGRLLYLCFLIYAFFGWFWCHGGQTIGMKAWKFRLEKRTSPPGEFSPISGRQAFLRLLVALISWTAFGLGFFWSLIRSDRCTWHDIASGSRLSMTPSTH